MLLTALEIAKHLNGKVLGNPGLELSGFSPADRAVHGDLTCAENETYFQQAEASAASAIMVSGDFTSTTKTLIVVPNARVAFARVLPLFFPEPTFAPGVHPSSVIGKGSKIHPSVHIGAACIIGENVCVGEGTILKGLVFVGSGSQIGRNCTIFPNVTVYEGSQIGDRVRIHSGSVVGSDGFGYVLDEGIHRKVPQIGNVIIGDDVELGACVTIDRGALGPTTIGAGTKIDNLVQIGHNVCIGEHCIVVSQVGIAGSCRLGNYVVLGGQVGIAGHIKIGNNVTIAAKSGVMNDIPDGEKLFGTPAIASLQARRQMVAISQLPELIKRVRDLEKRLGVKKTSDQV
jgi:UDP-3-O-[3-hydroxymyristoyl] glucosamine N-acyltransferase